MAAQHSEGAPQLLPGQTFPQWHTSLKCTPEFLTVLRFIETTMIDWLAHWKCPFDGIAHLRPSGRATTAVFTKQTRVAVQERIRALVESTMCAFRTKLGKSLRSPARSRLTTQSLAFRMVLMPQFLKHLRDDAIQLVHLGVGVVDVHRPRGPGDGQLQVDVV